MHCNTDLNLMLWGLALLFHQTNNVAAGQFGLISTTRIFSQFPENKPEYNKYLLYAIQ